MKKNQAISKNRIDMLNGSIAPNLLLFALPLAACNIIQVLFNSADVAVAGSFAGSEALAAVGANSPIVSLFVTILTGLSLGANVYISRMIGAARDKATISRAVHTAITFSIISGIILMIAALIFGKALLIAVGTPTNVLQPSITYLRIYCISLPFLMFYDFSASILRSIGDTRRPMMFLIISGILNVILNLILVIVFHMGVSGVAIATLISTICSSIFIFTVLTRETDPIKLDVKKLCLDKAHLKEILIIGTPAAIQSCVFSISNIIVQSGINSFGSDAVAGSSAALNYEYYAFYVVQSFGQAVVTFVSQNFGAKNLQRCRKILRTGMAEGMGLTAILCLIFFLFRDNLLLIYTSDAAVIAFGMQRLTRVAFLEPLTGLYDIPGAAIRGLGDSLKPAIITIIGTVVFRIFWINVIFSRFHTFDMLMSLYVVSWCLTGAIMLTTYFVTRRKVSKMFS